MISEKRNKKMTVTLVILVLLLVAVVGITYAYFSAKSNAVPQKVTTAKVDLLVEVNPSATHIKDIKPTTWNETASQNDDNLDVVKIPIKVTNRSTIDINYDLFITPNGLELNEEGTDGDEQKLVGGSLADIKYKLYEKTGTSLSEKPIIEGDFTAGKSKQKIVANKEIKALEEGKQDNIQNYILYIYIENKTSAQNKLQGIDFNLNIEGVTPAEKIAQTILANETSIEKQPEFTEISTDRGLYKLQDNSVASISNEDSDSNNKGSIYYYRGAVENNYVQFGTYTKDVINMIGYLYAEKQTVATKGSPILWRIVRINEDGSVKLIAEHNIGDGYHVWNNNDGYDSKADYIIDNGDGNKQDSNIKKTVDDWYNETFLNPTEDCQECQNNKELEKLVKITEFCNDRSNSYTAVKARLITTTPPEPTLKCTDSKDIVRSKAGLISADEMVYAGALYDKKVTDNTTYLNNNTSFWAISTHSSSLGFYAFHWCPDPDLLALRYLGVFGMEVAAARPVITLSPEAVIISGDGTSTRPYVIKSN